MTDKIKKAEKDYIKGMKYKDIASKYDVSINTVKSWKTRYKWDRNGVHTKDKSTHTKSKKRCTQKSNAPPKKEEPVLKEVQEILNNSGLTDKQRLFCIYYIKCFNATKAYKKAYKCDYITANTNGSRLLVKASIKEEIQKLKQNKLNRAMLSVDDILQQYIDIAYADLTDYADIGREKRVIGYDKDGEPVVDVTNYLDLKQGNEIDGQLVSEIKVGKQGASVKLHDKMKALDKLLEISEACPELRHRKEMDKERIQLEKDKFEHMKDIDNKIHW